MLHRFHFRVFDYAAGPAGPVKPNASGLLGYISIGLGVLALAVSWIPYFGMLGIPAAGAGVVVAFAGLIVGRLAGQRRVWIPFVGVLVCGLAIGMCFLATYRWQNRPGAPGRPLQPATPPPPAVDMRGQKGPFVPKPPAVTQPTFVIPKFDRDLPPAEGEDGR